MHVHLDLEHTEWSTVSTSKSYRQQLKGTMNESSRRPDKAQSTRPTDMGVPEMSGSIVHVKWNTLDTRQLKWEQKNDKILLQGDWLTAHLIFTLMLRRSLDGSVADPACISPLGVIVPVFIRLCFSWCWCCSNDVLLKQPVTRSLTRQYTNGCRALACPHHLRQWGCSNWNARQAES